jgi:hypothetical protein
MYHWLPAAARGRRRKVLPRLFRFLTAAGSTSSVFFFIHFVERALPDHPNHVYERGVKDEEEATEGRLVLLLLHREGSIASLPHLQLELQ